VVWDTPLPSCPEDKAHALEPVIVPPTWNKGSHEHQLENIWARARQELTEAHRWFIIGYSAPESDRFFQYLLASALAEVTSNLQEVIVINPGPGVEERYRKLFTRSFDDRSLKFEALKFPIDVCSSTIGMDVDEPHPQGMLGVALQHRLDKPPSSSR
jgi:hypothetical protein